MNSYRRQSEKRESFKSITSCNDYLLVFRDLEDTQFILSCITELSKKTFQP